MIHVIIPVFNRWKYTRECLLSLKNQEYLDFKTVVVDHGSTDGTRSKIKEEFPEVIVLTGNESMWWTAATNLGIKYSLSNGAEYVLTLNNDLIVEKDYLGNLMEIIKKFPKSVIGSVTVDKKNSNNVFYAGTRWNQWTAKYRTSINLKDFNTVQNTQETISTDLLPGRGTLIPVEVFGKVGLFDEKNFPHYAADEDFSLRCVKKGYQLLVATKAIVYSEVEATGLNDIHLKKNIPYWRDLFTSQRSPVNIKTRWMWAKLNSKFAPMYFIFDMIRIIGSQIKNKK